MNGYILNTHPVWFVKFEENIKTKKPIVFWNKSAKLPTDAITKGTFLFHRLTGTRKIEGISVVDSIEILPLGKAWEKYTTNLGYDSMQKLIDVSTRMEGDTSLSGVESPILCLVLTGLFSCSLDIINDLPRVGIFFGNYPKLPTVGKSLSEEQTQKLLSRSGYPIEIKKFFILRTGGGNYNDETGKVYHFKEGIPGYLQLKNAANSSNFVYLQDSHFIGYGDIGDIISSNENGVVNYYASIKDYQSFANPVTLSSIETSFSKQLTRAGIIEVTKSDFEKVLSTAKQSSEVITVVPPSGVLSEQQSEEKFKDRVRTLVATFKATIPERQAEGLHIENAYWENASNAFRIFWSLKIMGGKLNVNEGEELDDMDPIIRLLDSKGKRSYTNPETTREHPAGEYFVDRLQRSGDQYGLHYTIEEDEDKLRITGVEGVAIAMIPQNDWYTIFRTLNADSRLRSKLDEAFNSQTIEAKAAAIDALKSLDKDGVIVKRQAVAISAMLSLWNPISYVQAVSLRQRERIIEVFDLGSVDRSTFGKQVISTFQVISGFNEKFGTDLSIIELSYFLYSKQGRPLWQEPAVISEPFKYEANSQGSITSFLKGSSEPLITEHLITEPINLQADEVNTELTIPKELKFQVCSALNSGNHIIITGPVGTGKTTFSEDICKVARRKKFCDGYILTTASSDWTTFDTIGGYMPTLENRLRFEEGIFLEAIRQNKWLIIDEINRADIDKAFGQLFSVLSGQSVELPFKLSNGQPIVIQTTAEERSSYEDARACYKVGKNWRIIATMNIYDMNFLFEMSYAFMRRFAFIYMGLPENTETLIQGWCKENNLAEKTAKSLFALTSLAGRKFGPAIIKDMVDYLKLRGDGEPELAEAIISYILPQLEGLDKDKIEVAWQQILFIFSDKSIPNTKILPILQELTGLDLTPRIQTEKASP